MLIFRKEHNEWHLHTVRGNIFKKNQRRGVFYGGTYRSCGGVQDPDKRTADKDILKHHHHVQRHFINEGFKG